MNRMKSILPFLFLCISIPSISQLKEEFKKEEARDMIALCNSYPFLDVYNSDSDILPSGYHKIYTSAILGMDNVYQVYKNGHIAVINLRGSTANKISWMENIYSAMIPAKGTMTISGEKFNYCFAKNPVAAVHAGYALAIGFLSKDVLNQIDLLNKDGIHNIIIIGHSQGGALASMLRAYLENLPEEKISKKNKYKTYSFAAPMIGNQEFTIEYNNLYCIPKTSFNVVNPADMIPTFPLNYNESNFISGNLKKFLFDKESFSFQKMATDGVAILLEDQLIRYVNKVSYSVSEQISKDVGPVEIPPYVKDINYFKLGNIIEIAPVVYPKVLKDSTILQNDSLMAVYKRGPDGQFLNKELYAKEPWNYQHKPLNYYKSILKMYFPHEYHVLEKKHFFEKPDKKD
jgi:hypothetical protein